MSRRTQGGVVLLLAFVSMEAGACARLAPETAAIGLAPAVTQLSPTQEDRATPGATPVPSAGGQRESPTPAENLAQVHVTAVGGNVFIRRGPDVAFNPVGVLESGQAAVARARNVLGTWLEIDMPGDPEGVGWISILTRYTSISGDAQALPASPPTFWPVLASVRNCTHHQMIMEPGDIVIPPIENFPDNDVRANPGEYTISDLDVDGYPEVRQISVHEGSSIDIMVDGNGQKKKCPLP